MALWPRKNSPDDWRDDSAAGARMLSDGLPFPADFGSVIATMEGELLASQDRSLAVVVWDMFQAIVAIAAPGPVPAGTRWSLEDVFDGARIRDGVAATGMYFFCAAHHTVRTVQERVDHILRVIELTQEGRHAFMSEMPLELVMFYEPHLRRGHVPDALPMGREVHDYFYTVYPVWAARFAGTA